MHCASKRRDMTATLKPNGAPVPPSGESNAPSSMPAIDDDTAERAGEIRDEVSCMHIIRPTFVTCSETFA